MPGIRPKPGPRLALAMTIAGFVLAQLGLWLFADSANALHAWLWRAPTEWPAAPLWQRVLDRLLYHAAIDDVLPLACATGLLGAIVLIPLAFVLRTVARANVRARHADPLDRARAWTTAHPWWSGALAGAWAMNAARGAFFYFDAGHASPLTEKLWLTAAWALCAAAAAFPLHALLRRGASALLAPTLDAARPARAPVEKDEIGFDAVAVTGETRAAVGGMAAGTLAMTAWLATLSTHALYHDGRVRIAVAVYVLVALGGAALFRRASKVAVGADGVLIRGTSRTRFFAYRDLDAARVSAGDLELVRRDRVILRLQLHGEDAARRDAVLARIREAIDHVKEGRDGAAQGVAQAATVQALTRASVGAGDFRQPAVSRDALWKLVEGPTTDGLTRAAAAEALASTLDPSERPRLRVAAAHCAEPQTRVALEKLAEGELMEEASRAPEAPAMARRSA